jgi:hypothetical protein
MTITDRVENKTWLRDKEGAQHKGGLFECEFDLETEFNSVQCSEENSKVGVHAVASL